MNSPTPGQPPTFNGQPFNLSQPPQYRRNHSALSSGAVQNPSRNADGLATTHDALPSDGNNDKVKQRAKDVMAASGVDVRPNFAHNTSPATGSNNNEANGIPMTRKRSRSGSRIPARAPSFSNSSIQVSNSRNESLLENYIQRDLLHAAAINDQVTRSRDLFKYKEQEIEFYRGEGAKLRDQVPGAVFGYGYSGFGNGRTDQRTQLQYPATRRRPNKRHTAELRFSRKDANNQSECLEELVPLRLDIETEKLRLRDTFTWNLNDRLINPQMFADNLIEDLKLPAEQRHYLARQVHQEIVEQIQNYYPPIFPSDQPAEPGVEYWAHKNDDMRITIKLNITVGHIALVDQFEWDINDPHNSPEDFAQQMAYDLALSGEFTTAIAHSIREQSQLYVRSLYLSNYEFDGRPIEDPDIKDNMMASPFYSAFRPLQQQKDWAPFLFEVNEADMEKTELAMLREQRAQKRQHNRRGGPALPDLKDRPRTIRSLVVSSVIPGAAETLEASGIPKVRRTTGRAKRVVRDDGSDSDDLDLEESGADSPAPSAINTGTTARTRGIRGAASAAQAAMRNTYGRSQTPDLTPDARASTRRSGAHELREDTAEPASLVVKLRIAPAKYKQWLAKRKFGPSGARPLSGFPTSQAMLPQQVNALKPPTTPSMKKQSLPVAEAETSASQPPKSGESTPLPSSSAPVKAETIHNEQGRVDVDKTPHPDEDQPPLPPWLETALSNLTTKYPDSSFEGLMRFSAVSASTNEPVRIDHIKLPPGSSVPAGPIKNPDTGELIADHIKWQWLPRIRCNDCPKKVYNAVRYNTEGEFEKHLRNRGHRVAVEERKEKEKDGEGRKRR